MAPGAASAGLVPGWYEYDANVLVILAIAALAILACVVLVSLGKGGELTEFPPDVPPLNLPEAARLTAVDFMALQLPVNLVGYHTQSVDEALHRAATAISARDTRIAVLEQRVSELLSSRLHARQEVHAAPGNGPRTDHEPEAPATPRDLPENGDPVPDTGDHFPQAVDGSPAHAPAHWGAEEEPPAPNGDAPATYAASAPAFDPASASDSASDSVSDRELASDLERESGPEGPKAAGAERPERDSRPEDSEASGVEVPERDFRPEDSEASGVEVPERGSRSGTVSPPAPEAPETAGAEVPEQDSRPVRASLGKDRDERS